MFMGFGTCHVIKTEKTTQSPPAHCKLNGHLSHHLPHGIPKKKKLVGPTINPRQFALLQT
jgi:hypothetical protein